MCELRAKAFTKSSATKSRISQTLSQNGFEWLRMHNIYYIACCIVYYFSCFLAVLTRFRCGHQIPRVLLITLVLLDVCRPTVCPMYKLFAPPHELSIAHYIILLFSSLLYSTLLFSTLLYSTLLYSSISSSMIVYNGIAYNVEDYIV